MRMGPAWENHGKQSYRQKKCKALKPEDSRKFNEAGAVGVKDRKRGYESKEVEQESDSVRPSGPCKGNVFPFILNLVGS